MIPKLFKEKQQEAINFRILRQQVLATLSGQFEFLHRTKKKIKKIDMASKKNIL